MDNSDYHLLTVNHCDICNEETNLYFVKHEWQYLCSKHFIAYKRSGIAKRSYESFRLSYKKV